MLAAVIQFAVAAVVIIIAGTALTRSSDAIAEHTGLGRLLVGTIFLASATSLPELLVDINAVRQGAPDLAVGDLLGSSLANLLILAAIDLWQRSERSMLSHAAAAHALSGTVSISLTALAALGILVSPHIPGAHWVGIGIFPMVILAAYIFSARMLYYDQRMSAALAERAAPELGAPVSMSLRKAIGVYLGSALFIVLAAPYLAEAAGEIADLSGLGKTFIGTTLVAVCTSLPELVSTLSAVRMGAYDLALGNIFGSNSYNMTILAPLDLFHSGPMLAAVSPIHVVTACATILITTIAVMGQLYQVEKRKFLLEPDAALIIVLVLTAMWLVYYLGQAQQPASPPGAASRPSVIDSAITANQTDPQFAARWHTVYFPSNDSGHVHAVAAPLG